MLFHTRFVIKKPPGGTVLKFSFRFVALETTDKSHYFGIHFWIKIENDYARQRVLGIEPVEQPRHFLYSVVFGNAVVTRIESEFFEHNGIVVSHRADVQFRSYVVFGIGFHQKISEIPFENFFFFNAYFSTRQGFFKHPIGRLFIAYGVNFFECDIRGDSTRFYEFF